MTDLSPDQLHSLGKLRSLFDALPDARQPGKVADVVFGEDHCQVRDTAAAHNLSILREMALKALRNETSKGSLRSKRKRASLDPSFRLGLLLALQA